MGLLGPPNADKLCDAPADKRPAYGAFLARMGATGVPALLEASGDPDPMQRAGAALSLGLVGTPSATDPDHRVRGVAQEALDGLPG
jgi:HEAT repeat protein